MKRILPAVALIMGFFGVAMAYPEVQVGTASDGSTIVRLVDTRVESQQCVRLLKLPQRYRVLSVSGYYTCPTVLKERGAAVYAGHFQFAGYCNREFHISIDDWSDDLIVCATIYVPYIDIHYLEFRLR